MIRARSPAEQVEAYAVSARDLNTDQRCWAVLGLIRDGISAGVPPERLFLLAYGHASGRQFWSDWFSTSLTINGFIKLLEAPLGMVVNTSVVFPTQALSIALTAAPAELVQSGSAIQPRVVAQWLLDGRFRHLVHPSLAVYLTGFSANTTVPPTTPSAHHSGRVGRPADKREEVRRKMREHIASHSADDLKRMKGKELTRFGGEITMCKLARDEVLGKPRTDLAIISDKR